MAKTGKSYDDTASIEEIDALGKATGRSWSVPMEYVRALGVDDPADLLIWTVSLGYYTEASQGDPAFVNIKQRDFDTHSLWLIDCPVLGYTAARSRANGDIIELIGPNGKVAPVGDDHRDRVVGKIIAVLGRVSSL